MQSYAKPEPNRPKFSVGLPKSISNDEALTPEEAPGKPGNLSETIVHPSRFSKERADGARVTGLIPYADARRNEERYERVLKEMDEYLPKKVKDALSAFVRDRKESAIEIRDALPNLYDENGIPNVGHEQAFWVRAKSPVKGGDGAHKAALAYASEWVVRSLRNLDRKRFSD